MSAEELQDLADRLRDEGAFEHFKKVWLSEEERDAIVDALYSAACALTS